MKKQEKNTDLLDDLSQIEAYKTSKDLEALSPFFKKYMGLIYGVCLKYLKDQEQSKDAVMEVYEKLTSKLLKHEIANPKSWLYTLTKNHCYEILRSKKRVMEKESDAQLMYSEQVFRPYNDDDKEVKLDLLDTCIASLENMQQNCVKLFYLEKKTYKEICAILSIKWDKARSLIQNGRRNLKLCMEKNYESIREK